MRHAKPVAQDGPPIGKARPVGGNHLFDLHPHRVGPDRREAVHVRSRGKQQGGGRRLSESSRAEKVRRIVC